MTQVERRELAAGFEIARVLNGLWQVADMESDGNTLDPVTAASAMQPLVAAGFTTFDMADHYGSAEIIAGHFNAGQSADSRAQMLTKWVPEPGKVTRQAVRKAVERALSRLHCECIDLLQFHAWHYPDPSWLDALFWLDELRSEGLVSHLGVTNFDAAHLRIALATGLPIVSNQVSFSLLDQRAAGALSEVCQEYGTHLLAYGTLAGGLLSERWLGAARPAEALTMSQMKYLRFIDAAGGWNKYQLVLEAADLVARKHDVSIAVVSSRYILDQAAVAGVILGTRLGQSDHVKENLDLFALKLEPADRELLSSAIEELDTIPGDCGDEYRKPPFLTAAGNLSDHLDTIPPVFEPVDGDNGTQRVFSGTSWETSAGYCRALRRGDRILVSGTTATHGDRVIGGEDAAAQTHFAIDKIQAAIESLGGRLEDVIRTRIYVNEIDDWEPVARAHGERFGNIQPANTLVEARLVGTDYKVEVEAEAFCAAE